MGGPGSNELVGIRADGGLFPIGVQSCEIRLRGYGEGRIVLIRDLSPIALVVDDEPQVTRMTAFLMRHIGYQVIAYTSSRQALADYQPGVPSVIVSDILMPDLDGVVMTQRMRKVDPTVPVIFVSGFSTETVPQGDGSIFVKKPFVITDLQNALKELPERARARLQCAPPRG
jgi:FixJ family two-component response regulator